MNEIILSYGSNIKISSRKRLKSWKVIACDMAGNIYIEGEN